MSDSTSVSTLIGDGEVSVEYCPDSSEIMLFFSESADAELVTRITLTYPEWKQCLRVFNQFMS
jgi:hypothetical protein